MAANYYRQHTADGKSHIARRSKKQGRRPSGLAPAQLVRLYSDDKIKLAQIAEKLGYLYNENEIIRSAVRAHLNSVYTELLNT